MPVITKKNDTTKKDPVEHDKSIKIELNKNISVLFSEDDDPKIREQFINVLEMGIFNKKLKSIKLEIITFTDILDLEKILDTKDNQGKIYIGPISDKFSKLPNKYCDKGAIFFSFSSNVNFANKCIYLINFFPKNELEQLFSYLDDSSKVALLFPENKYGYMINSLIDDIANNSNAIIVNRASYKNDLSNVRDAIIELGRYELRKYELDRQKIILSNKNDSESIKRLKKLQKFQTTNDYDFTHILIADYGLNLLRVAPLLPYYDIDPKIVQFMGTGVIDDDNFFSEPSLQGAIFPGIEKEKRADLINNYESVYDESLIRISTLPYDLLGLLSYVFENNMSLSMFKNLLNNSNIKFEGIDGNFYFNENMIERQLKILKISNGKASNIN